MNILNFLNRRLSRKQKIIYNELISQYNFDEAQKEEIKLGLKKKLNISLYAKPEFTYKQMLEIRLGLEQNLNVSIYAKPELRTLNSIVRMEDTLAKSCIWLPLNNEYQIYSQHYLVEFICLIVYRLIKDKKFH